MRFVIVLYSSHIYKIIGTVRTPLPQGPEHRRPHLAPAFSCGTDSRQAEVALTGGAADLVEEVSEDVKMDDEPAAA